MSSTIVPAKSVHNTQMETPQLTTRLGSASVLSVVYNCRYKAGLVVGVVDRLVPRDVRYDVCKPYLTLASPSSPP